MRLSILLDIFSELLSQRKTTAKFIAEKHGISERTAYRYVELLSEQVPVQIQRGRNGGIFISDAYKLPAGCMTPTEYAAAVEALSQSYARSPEERFLSARQKLSRQEKTERRNLFVTNASATVLFDSGVFGDAVLFTEKLRLFEECIRECAVVSIEYTALSGERSRRKIEPHALVFRHGLWHVYAFCRKRRAFRLFRLGSIESAVISGEKFIRRPFRREEALPACQTPDIPCVKVALEIGESALSDVKNRLGCSPSDRGRGKWYADIQLPDDGELIQKLLSLGSAVRVLFPESVKTRLREEVKKIAKLYE